MVTLTFAAAFAATPKSVFLTPANSGTAALSGVEAVWADAGNLSVNGFHPERGDRGAGGVHDV